MFLSFAPESALEDNLLCKHRGKQIFGAQIRTLSCSVVAGTELLPLGKCRSSSFLFMVYEEILEHTNRPCFYTSCY